MPFGKRGLHLPREAGDLPDDRLVNVREPQSTLLEDTEHCIWSMDECTKLFPAQLEDEVL